MVVSSAVLVLVIACGKSSNRDGRSRETTPDAGETGAGGSVSNGGSRTRGGTAGADTGGSNVGGESASGGEPSDGGAPAGGSAGASPGGFSGGGSSNAGAATAGAAGSAGVGVPDGCEPGSQLVSAAYCSTAMTCGARRLNISCAENGGVWSCSCSDPRSRVDYDFPRATGVATCEAAAKACADPDLLTGDETCTRSHSENADMCSIRDDCVRSHVIDGVTLRTRTERSASCRSCGYPEPTTCCSCADRLDVDYRLEELNLAAGCNFLGELCKPDSYEPVGAKNCEILSEITYPDACGVSSACTQPIELGDGTRLSTYETFETGCGPRYPEGMVCTCRNWAGQYALTLDPGSTPPRIGLCRGASAACAGLETIVATAPRACSSEVSAMSNGCTIDSECSQPATIGGLAVSVLTDVGAQCELQVDGTWLCFCTRSGTSLEVEADDSESACDRAADACPIVSSTF